MQCEDVVSLYQDLEVAGVGIWIDGGWSVDALVGRETRPHNDLDIAVEARNVPRLCDLLALRGYREVSADGARWSFVVADERGCRIDIHVVVLDDQLGVLGEPLEGIAYPAGSLTGHGVLGGVPVRCVRADFMLQFKTSYPPRPVDHLDVAALCELLGRPIPETYR